MDKKRKKREGNFMKIFGLLYEKFRKVYMTGPNLCYEDDGDTEQGRGRERER